MNYESDYLGSGLVTAIVGGAQSVASDAMQTYQYIKGLEAQMAQSKDQVEVARLQAQLATAKVELARQQAEASGSKGGAAKTAAVVGGLAALGITVAAIS